VQAFVSSYLQRYELVESPALADVTEDDEAENEMEQAADEAVAKAQQRADET
jgi:hypothetical protein